MSIIKQIEFTSYDKQLNLIYFKFHEDSRGSSSTSFNFNNPKLMYKDMYYFLKNTLNVALESEKMELIDLDQLDKEKIVNYLRKLLSLIEDIETKKNDLKKYLESREKISGFSVNL